MSENTTVTINKKLLDPIRSEITCHTKLGIDRWFNRAVQHFNGCNNLALIRILGLLFSNSGHTKIKIAKILNLWEDLISEKLNWLNKEGFIHADHINFGIDFFGRRRTIQVYDITELGRFLLHQLDMQFPGLWMTISVPNFERSFLGKDLPNNLEHFK